MTTMVFARIHIVIRKTCTPDNFLQFLCAHYVIDENDDSRLLGCGGFHLTHTYSSARTAVLFAIHKTLYFV